MLSTFGGLNLIRVNAQIGMHSWTCIVLRAGACKGTDSPHQNDRLFLLNFIVPIPKIVSLDNISSK